MARAWAGTVGTDTTFSSKAQPSSGSGLKSGMAVQRPPTYYLREGARSVGTLLDEGSERQARGVPRCGRPHGLRHYNQWLIDTRTCISVDFGEVFSRQAKAMQVRTPVPHKASGQRGVAREPLPPS